MSNSANAEELLKLVDSLINLKSMQEDIDKWYSNFIQIYHQEMSNFNKKLEDTPKSRKNYYISRKAWWCDELSDLASKTHTAEK